MGMLLAFALSLLAAGCVCVFLDERRARIAAEDEAEMARLGQILRLSPPKGTTAFTGVGPQAATKGATS
jgi:hypothetical protein